MNPLYFSGPAYFLLLYHLPTKNKTSYLYTSTRKTNTEKRDPNKKQTGLKLPMNKNYDYGPDLLHECLVNKHFNKHTATFFLLCQKMYLK